MANAIITDQRHPLVAKKLTYEWPLATLSYNGGRDYVDNSKITVLFGHPREKTTNYANRKARAYFPNYCGPITDRFVSEMMSAEVTREVGALQPFMDENGEDIDLKGNSFPEFMRGVAQEAAIRGQAWVLVDTPAFDTATVTNEAQAQEAGIRPYLVHITTDMMMDWSLDSFGKPRWIKFRQLNPWGGDPSTQRLATPEYTYIVWTMTESVRYGNDGIEVEGSRIKHAYGFIPIVPVYFKEVADWAGVALIRDTVEQNKALYNMVSLVDQILYDQTFSILMMQADKGEVDPTEVGTGTGIIYPPERDMPAFISPDPEQARVIAERVASLIEDIYRTVGITNRSGDASVIAQSGASKSFDLADLDVLLKGFARSLETAETQILTTLAKVLEVSEEGISVRYPNTFDIRAFADRLESAMDVISMAISPTFDDKVYEDLVVHYFQDLPEKELETIRNEIKTRANLPTIPEDTSQAPFQDGNGGDNVTEEGE